MIPSRGDCENCGQYCDIDDWHFCCEARVCKRCSRPMGCDPYYAPPPHNDYTFHVVWEKLKNK